MPSAQVRGLRHKGHPELESIPRLCVSCEPCRTPSPGGGGAGCVGPRTPSDFSLCPLLGWLCGQLLVQGRSEGTHVQDHNGLRPSPILGDRFLETR